jgi:hypothetical protein
VIQKVNAKIQTQSIPEILIDNYHKLWKSFLINIPLSLGRSTGCLPVITIVTALVLPLEDSHFYTEYFP